MRLKSRFRQSRSSHRQPQTDAENDRNAKSGAKRAQAHQQLLDQFARSNQLHKGNADGRRVSKKYRIDAAAIELPERKKNRDRRRAYQIGMIVNRPRPVT